MGLGKRSPFITSSENAVFYVLQVSLDCNLYLSCDNWQFAPGFTPSDKRDAFWFTFPCFYLI